MEYGVSGNNDYLQAKRMWQIKLNKEKKYCDSIKQEKSHNLSSL